MVSHPWERWDRETQRRMADELVFHGAARARLVRDGLEIVATRYLVAIGEAA